MNPVSNQAFLPTLGIRGANQPNVCRVSQDTPKNPWATVSNAIAAVAANFDKVAGAVLRTDVSGVQAAFDGKDKDLQSEDKLGNFEIQGLMSDYNEAQTPSSSVEKKADDAKNSIPDKL